MESHRITPKLCEFVGALIGDGNLWTDGSRFRIELTGHPTLDREYFVYLSEIEYKLFGKRPYDLKVHQGGLRLTLQLKEAFMLLTDLSIPFGKGKAKSVTIPKSILNKNWNCIRRVIRGIFDTDGTVFFSKKTYSKPIYPTLEISTISQKLAYQLREQLLKHGFRVHVRRIDRVNYNPEYKISIYGTKMLELWFKEIGSSNSKHVDKFVNYKNLYKHS